MKTLEEVLKELEDAEKEFKEKCDHYGINDKQKVKDDETITSSSPLKKVMQ